VAGPQNDLIKLHGVCFTQSVTARQGRKIQKAVYSLYICIMNVGQHSCIKQETAM